MATQRHWWVLVRRAQVSASGKTPQCPEETRQGPVRDLPRSPALGKSPFLEPVSAPSPLSFPESPCPGAPPGPHLRV